MIGNIGIHLCLLFIICVCMVWLYVFVCDILRMPKMCPITATYLRKEIREVYEDGVRAEEINYICQYYAGGSSCTKSLSYLPKSISTGDTFTLFVHRDDPNLISYSKFSVPLYIKMFKTQIWLLLLLSLVIGFSLLL